MPGEFFSKRCFLFDLDGTLVDSTPFHARAFVETLKTAHPDLARRFDYANFAGRPTWEVLTALGLGAEPELTALTRRKQHLYRAALERGEVNAFPGVGDLLAQLREEEYRLFVVTGASRLSAQSVLKLTKLEEFFEGVVTADDTPLGKPSPEPYAHVLNTYGVAAQDCLAIEDGESGVRSAQAAGIEVVLIHTDLQLSGVPHVRDAGHLARLLRA